MNLQENFTPNQPVIQTPIRGSNGKHTQPEELLTELIADSQDTANPARFTVTWAQDVYNASEPLECVIDGLITKASLNFLVGAPGHKKTAVASDLAVCTAKKEIENWIGFHVNHTNVLIVDEESGPRRLRRRLYETLNGH